MKQISLILLCFSFSLLQSNAQSNSSISLKDKSKVVCRYALTYVPDSTSPATKQSLFFLISDGKSSVFKEEAVIKEDSLLTAYQSKPMSEGNVGALTAQMRQMPAPAFPFAIYKNYSSKEVSYVDKIDKVVYFYVETPGFLDWRLTSEEKKMAGYTCRKATATFGGRTWDAWFTREVPISDGPYKFYGLPGLIVQVADTRNQYVFSLQKTSQSNPAVSVYPPTENTSKTTKKVFVQAKKDYTLSAPSRMAARGVAVPEARIQAYMERLKKQNNPLELK